MRRTQIEDGIRQLQQKEQLQLLAWLARHIQQHLPEAESGTLSIHDSINLDEIAYPLEGTLLKYEEPFESVALDDWDVLQ